MVFHILPLLTNVVFFILPILLHYVNAMVFLVFNLIALSRATEVVMSVMSLAIPEHMADVLDEWGAISLILEKIILGASVLSWCPRCSQSLPCAPLRGFGSRIGFILGRSQDAALLHTATWSPCTLLAIGCYWFVLHGSRDAKLYQHERLLRRGGPTDCELHNLSQVLWGSTATLVSCYRPAGALSDLVKT